MNRQNFEAKDRFPLSTQSLTFMQDMIMAVSRLALIGGENYILSGCERNGSHVADGIVVIRGEVMPLKGGIAVDTIAVIEEAVAVSADGMDFDNARVKRYAQFASGTGDNYYAWSGFRPLATNTRLEEVKATTGYVDERITGIQQQLVPAGAIVMWSGNSMTVPQGWILCDGRMIPGTNTRTPDLRGRFVVGYNPSDSEYGIVGNKGGNKQIALKEENTPSHRHLNGLANSKNWGFEEQGALYKPSKSAIINTQNGATFYQGYTSRDGEGRPFDNRPPYYVLAFIMKIDTK